MEKGEQIGLSGATGDVSGPHLHFQIDRDTAPWHPYWPFSSDELSAAKLSENEAIDSGFHSERGYAYTVNPLLYVQANYAAPLTIVQNDGASSSSAASVAQNNTSTWLSRVQARIEKNKATRVVRQQTIVAIVTARSLSSSSESSSVSSPAPNVVQKKEVVVYAVESPATTGSTPVATVEITHNGSYSGRGWERVRITLLDAQGNVVTSPNLDHDIVLRAAFGSADFQPQTLSVLDFQNGKAEIGVLPHGRRTLIIQVMPFNVLSAPMKYEKE